MTAVLRHQAPELPFLHSSLSKVRRGGTGFPRTKQLNLTWYFPFEPAGGAAPCPEFACCWSEKKLKNAAHGCLSFQVNVYTYFLTAPIRRSRNRRRRRCCSASSATAEWPPVSLEDAGLMLFINCFLGHERTCARSHWLKRPAYKSCVKRMRQRIKMP